MIMSKMKSLTGLPIVFSTSNGELPFFHPKISKLSILYYRKFPVIVDLGSYKGLIGANLYDVCLTNGLVFVFDFSIIQDTVQCIVHCSSSLKSLVYLHFKAIVTVNVIYILFRNQLNLVMMSKSKNF